MKLSYLLIRALILSMVTASAAFAAPPDQIPNSLIPPLKEQPTRPTTRAAAAARTAGAAAARSPAPANGATREAEQAAAPAPSTPEGATDSYAPEPAARNDYEARAALWNSPEMIDARRYVLAYSQRSAQSSLKEGEQFLANVSRLSSSEMKGWLERLQARRATIARQQEVTSTARQLSMEQAAQRLEEARQAQTNINQWQSLSAMYMQSRMQSQQLATQQQRSLRELSRSSALANQRVLFDPFAPTLDPASPSRRTRAFAAATLPGDLPRSDPRNFIRGDEGVDTGESGVSQSGGPAPTPAPAPEGAGPPTSGE